MSMQAVSPAELQSIEGGFNWGAAVEVAWNTTVATGSAAAGLVAGLKAGLFS